MKFPGPRPVNAPNPDPQTVEFDHSSDPNFYAYYANQSASPEAIGRFRRIQLKVLRLLGAEGHRTAGLQIADIGCGAGTQCRLWAELGHGVHGIDVNEPLIELARTRAQEAGLAIKFDVGTATELPYRDACMDVCLLPELLEHVVDWQSCLNEAVRVLRAGGVLYLSTSNALCPLQEEFNLPLYSWYPGFLKRRYERLALTTRPELANHAKYPAVNWFTFYGLRDYLAEHGLESLDRFDMIDTKGRSAIARATVASVRAIPPLRLIGHILTPGTAIFAIRRA
jgi:2-polyprenyl-6-hydroxyphenyl methylase/3-demethylubiquinone-9 3-methyltransferase